MTLQSPVTEIKGVGATLAGKLATLNIKTVEDLLYFLPRRYDDFSNVIKIADIAPGNVTIKAKIEAITGRYIRKLHITEAILDDGTAKTRAIWFNQPFRAKQMKTGEFLYFSGSYELQRNRYLLSNPVTEKVSDFTVSTGRIVPIYHQTAGITSLQIRKMMRELLPLIKMLPETLPKQVLQSQQLLDINRTLLQLHFPDSGEQLDKARERMAFQELLELLLASLLNKQDNALLRGYNIPFSKIAAEEFTASLPFKMTGAQKRSAWEILQDFEQPQPMNRLLQGDVGSGKTAVAAMAIYMAIKAGYQTALMAPTEILAAQHANTLAQILEPLGAKIALLTGSLQAKSKKLLQQMLADGQIDVAVGTHALIQKDSQFKNLGFVVIDEQHRFGVDQRAELLKKSELMPHLLSMTATPIPRSLQLTAYGELEVSIIDELPAGRQAIQTKLCSPFQRKQVYEFADQQIAEGRQIYVVCPLVGEGAMAELKSVKTEYEQLNKTVFGHRRLAMLHGQLKAEEKEHVMQQFKNGQIDVLIATSVIEVGVDVPNATVMLIEGAERFGLAQLHQLRGRVGRGKCQSYCYLIPSSGKRPSERLLELEQSQDGFYLAEVDLRLRGPGEIYGRMQHGALSLQVASLADTKQIKRVRACAEELLKTDFNLLQYKQLHKRVSRYRKLTSLN